MEGRRSQQPENKKYRIGKVAKMTGVQPFVLRFWEKEFSLKLPKAKSGHRYYRQKDVQKILTIKRLLYTEGYTIKGALQKLNWGEEDLGYRASAKVTPRESSYRRTLQHIRADLEQMLKDVEQI